LLDIDLMVKVKYTLLMYQLVVPYQYFIRNFLDHPGCHLDVLE
jgi:hypothetical protein